jgi:HEAT repeat protein
MNAEPTTQADSPEVADLLARLHSRDDAVRGPAFHNAGPLGAPAVRSLARAMSDADPEAARAAKRALWNVVHHAGRPGATREALAVERALVALPPSQPNSIRREVIWMLSEIGGSESIPHLAALLSDPLLREDARCALQRIPGTESLAVLRRAQGSTDPSFAEALADALRARGEKVDHPPSRKLQPTRRTTVGV